MNIFIRKLFLYINDMGIDSETCLVEAAESKMFLQNCKCTYLFSESLSKQHGDLTL
jgi:hypothetical protein